MKKTKRTLASAAAALAASAALAVPSSALLTVYQGGTSGLLSNNGTWKVTFDLTHNDEVAKTEKMYFVVSVTDPEKYSEEKAAGHYITDEPAETDENGEEIPPEEFTDFQGQVGVSTEEWYDYTYESFDNSEPTDTVVGIKDIGGGKYIITIDLKARNVVFGTNGSSVTLGEWGNRSSDYTLSVEELYLCGADDEPIVWYDPYGNPDYEHAALVIPEDAPAAETQETEADTETSAPEDTAAGATDTEAAGETTTAASAAPASTTAGNAAPSAANTDFGTRDMTLVIVGIAAGVIILAVIVALVIVMTKKKK